MPRSIMPAVTTIHADWRGRIPCVFDIDGLPVEMRVEQGEISPNSLQYYILRYYERRSISLAKAVIGRSKYACRVYRRRDLRPSPKKYFCAWNGRDDDIFRPAEPSERARTRKQLNIDDDAVVVCFNGSFGERYTPNDMLEIFNRIKLRFEKACLLILTPNPEKAHAYIRQETPVLALYTQIFKLTPSMVPTYLAAADVGLCLYSISKTNKSLHPVKLGEYLLCGLPIIASNHVVDKELADARACFLVKNLCDEECLARLNDWLFDYVLKNQDEVRKIARRLGKKYLSLDATVAQYAAALRSAHDKK